MLNSIIKTAPLNDGTKGCRFTVLNTISGFYRKRSIKNRYQITKGSTTIGIHFGKRSLLWDYRNAMRKFHRLVV